MKRYKVRYFLGNRSKPEYLFQLSKSGKWNGVRIYFWIYGQKIWQNNWKNGSRNGIYKHWWGDSKNWNFRNWKKGNEQGIQIKFKR